jgi:hypothetical protein
MTGALAGHEETLKWCVAGLDLLSALLGMLGSYFAAKRYTRSFFSGIRFAALTLWLYCRGKQSQVNKVFNERYRANADIPDTPSDMALGLHLIFLAFLVQLSKIILAAVFGKG